MPPCRQGIVFVLSAPSGAGKTTISQRLVASMPDVVQVITCTTRAPRAHEVDGQAYHFLTREAFEQHIAAGAFLEWAQVHGHFYGTLRQSVSTATTAGNDVLLVIDVQGAAQLRTAGVGAVLVFVLPPSWEVLAQRLRARNSEPAHVQSQRLVIAREEVAHYTAYDYAVINDRLEDAVAAVRAIILAERQRIMRLAPACLTSLLAGLSTKG